MINEEAPLAEGSASGSALELVGTGSASTSGAFLFFLFENNTISVYIRTHIRVSAVESSRELLASSGRSTHPRRRRRRKEEVSEGV